MGLMHGSCRSTSATVLSTNLVLPVEQSFTRYSVVAAVVAVEYFCNPSGVFVALKSRPGQLRHCSMTRIPLRLRPHPGQRGLLKARVDCKLVGFKFSCEYSLLNLVCNHVMMSCNQDLSCRFCAMSLDHPTDFSWNRSFLLGRPSRWKNCAFCHRCWCPCRPHDSEPWGVLDGTRSPARMPLSVMERSQPSASLQHGPSRMQGTQTSRSAGAGVT